MPEYSVKVDERFTHTVIIEAASKEEAVASAYELLRNGLSKEEEILLDYRLDSDGFTGEHSVDNY